MAITGSQKAYKQARSGIMRSGTSRSGYYTPNVVIVLDGVNVTNAGIIIDSLRIELRINDEPDQASFRIRPGAAITAPIYGQHVWIGLGTAENRIFAGQVVRVESERRMARNVTPFVDVQCLDWTKLFNRRRCNWAYAGTSASVIGRDIVGRFTSGFTYRGIPDGLPTLSYFSMRNEEPLTALRRLANQINGWCYVDPDRDVHLWSGTDPSRPSPTPLTNGVYSLEKFESAIDGSQIRNRVHCEYKRTTCPVPILRDEFPYVIIGLDRAYKIPVESADPFEPYPTLSVARIGSQRFVHNGVVQPLETDINESTVTTAAAVIGATTLEVAGFAGSPAESWCRIGDQYIWFGGQASGPTRLTSIPASGLGSITGPISSGAQVTYLPVVVQIDADDFVANEPKGSEVISYVTVSDPVSQSDLIMIEGGDGIHEHVISDSRLDKTAATAVAQAEVDAFSNPLVRASWETRDLAALPGAQQVINLTSPSVVSATLTIISVDLSFTEKRYYPPLRRVEAGTVKQSAVIDVFEPGY